MTGITATPALDRDQETGRTSSKARAGAATGRAGWPRAAANPLERLVQIVGENDRLMASLEVARGRIMRARQALATPAGNTRLGAHYLDHCKAKHRGILTQLRANRIEAARVLGTDDGAMRAGA